MDDLSKNQANFLILSHLIFVCQERKKLLIPYGYEEKTFWSDGYFCGTIGNASQETIRQYIESQG